MANRRLEQFQLSYQRIPIHAWAKITFGSTGAPTLTTNPLFSGVTRNSAGDYTLALRDLFKQGIISVDHVFNTGSGTGPAAPGMWIRTDSSTSSTKTIRIVFNTGGTATDPASGEIVLLHFVFNDQTITF